MKHWLEYATQVSELEKIARLAPTTVVDRRLPELVPSTDDAACLVCGARPARSCAACGAVSYCGVEHQRADARWHNAVCDALAEVAEDQQPLEGDLVSELLARAARCADVRSLAGWDDFLGPLTPTRKRRLSDLATRPLTLASMLSALEVHRPGVVSVHVMAAAERELEVPAEVWAIAGRLVTPNVQIEVTLIGPELPDRSGVGHRRGLYGRELWRDIGQPDLVIGFDCGLMMYPTWKSTILGLRGSGVPFVITSFREWEAAAEARLLSAVRATCLLRPAANRWASLMGKRSSTIANDLSFDNAFVSAWQ
jgi:hypothetical protein